MLKPNQNPSQSYNVSKSSKGRVQRRPPSKRLKDFNPSKVASNNQKASKSSCYQLDKNSTPSNLRYKWLSLQVRS